MTGTEDTATDDTQAAQEPPQVAPEAPEAPQATEDAVDAPQDDDSGKGGKEAAKYRIRAREAEAERDALAERLAAMQRTEAERLAGQHIANGSALWAAGTDLADVLDDAGNVSPDLVHGAVEDAKAALGLATRSGTPAPDPTQGAKSGTFAANPWVEAMGTPNR